MPWPGWASVVCVCVCVSHLCCLWVVFLQYWVRCLVDTLIRRLLVSCSGISLVFKKATRLWLANSPLTIVTAGNVKHKYQYTQKSLNAPKLVTNVKHDSTCYLTYICRSAWGFNSIPLTLAPARQAAIMVHTQHGIIFIVTGIRLPQTWKKFSIRKYLWLS